MSEEVERGEARDFLGIANQSHWFNGFSYWISQELFLLVKKFTSNEDEQYFILISLAEFAAGQLKVPLDSAILDMAINGSTVEK